MFGVALKIWQCASMQLEFLECSGVHIYICWCWRITMATMGEYGDVGNCRENSESVL